MPFSLSLLFLDRQSYAVPFSNGFRDYVRATATPAKSSSRKTKSRSASTNGQAAARTTTGRLSPAELRRSVQNQAQVFKVLADEIRLGILASLLNGQAGELNVTGLCKRLGQSQP